MSETTPEVRIVHLPDDRFWMLVAAEISRYHDLGYDINEVLLRAAGALVEADDALRNGLVGTVTGPMAIQPAPQLHTHDYLLSLKARASGGVDVKVEVVPRRA